MHGRVDRCSTALVIPAQQASAMLMTVILTFMNVC